MAHPPAVVLRLGAGRRRIGGRRRGARRGLFLRARRALAGRVQRREQRLHRQQRRALAGGARTHPRQRGVQRPERQVRRVRVQRPLAALHQRLQAVGDLLHVVQPQRGGAALQGVDVAGQVVAGAAGGGGGVPPPPGPPPPPPPPPRAPPPPRGAPPPP